MNLARARELGISRQVEPALRGVTHVATPRVRRRRSRRLTSEEGVPGVAASQPAAAASGDASESSGEESDGAAACDAAERAPQDAGEAPADAEGEAPKPGVTRSPALDDGAGDCGAAASEERAADADASCSAAAADLPPVSGLTRLDAADWMGQLAAALWDLPLHKIRIPGTHDSGAYALSKRHMAPSKLPRWLVRLNRRAWWLTRPFSGLVVRWGEAQRLDVAGQLAAGARYLDLRIVNVRGAFHVAHGMLGAEVHVVLDQVAAFLDAHPGEVVVCDCNHFHHFTCRADHELFLAVLTARLGRHLARRELRARDGSVTLGALVAAGTRCVLLYGGCDFMGVAAAAAAARCWPRTLRDIVSPWPRAASWPELQAKLGVLDAAGANTRGFFVLQGVVTPNARLIRRGLLRRPSSLRAVSATVTPEVVQMVASGALTARCVVLLDHIDVADVTHMLAAAYAPHLLAAAPPADAVGARQASLAAGDGSVSSFEYVSGDDEAEDAAPLADSEADGGAWLDGAEAWAENAESPAKALLSLLLKDGHFDTSGAAQSEDEDAT